MERYVQWFFVEDQREFVEHLQIGKQIGEFMDVSKRPQAQKHIFCGGVTYNSLNSTFKIALKKGLDSEDTDRRDSINRLIISSFCRADGKLYKKPIFSLPNGKTQKSV